MRTLCAVAVAVLLLIVPSGASARGTQRPTCYPPHSKTLAANTRIRVFQTSKVVGHVHVTYGCLLSRKRPRKFLLPDFPTAYGSLALASPYVAYASYSDCAAAFCNPNSVVLQDLRSGRATPVQGPQVLIEQVTDLVLKPSGSLAFIASTFDQTGMPQPGLDVVKVELGAQPVILDSGAGVVAGSLALSGGSALYWTDGSTPMFTGLN